MEVLRKLLYRAITFGETYIPNRDDIYGNLNRHMVTQLILQHLQFEGLKRSRLQLESSTGTKLHPHLIDMNESRLVNVLRIALKETERVWDLTMRMLDPRNVSY